MTLEKHPSPNSQAIQNDILPATKNPKKLTMTEILSWRKYWPERQPLDQEGILVAMEQCDSNKQGPHWLSQANVSILNEKVLALTLQNMMTLTTCLIELRAKNLNLLDILNNQSRTFKIMSCGIYSWPTKKRQTEIQMERQHVQLVKV